MHIQYRPGFTTHAVVDMIENEEEEVYDDASVETQPNTKPDSTELAPVSVKERLKLFGDNSNNNSNKISVSNVTINSCTCTFFHDSSSTKLSDMYSSLYTCSFDVDFEDL